MLNYTYVYFCPNEEDGQGIHYKKIVHQLENQKLYQCVKCSNIEGKECQDEYSIECQVCGHLEAIEGDITFDKQMVCLSCGIRGKIGFEEGEQFLLKQIATVTEECSVCHRKNWKEVEEIINCPFCRTPLKVKMSNYWDKEMEES